MIAAIIQARMGSTRLPGKVLMDLCGKPVLEHIIDRIKYSRSIDKIIVATTDSEKDKAIITLSRKCGVETFAGSEMDVLDRYYRAASEYEVDTIVRITADDPLKDPEVIDKVINSYFQNNGQIDYASNTIKPTYPLGLDTEVFSLKGLERAWKESDEQYDREHVTPYIWRNPQIFRLHNVTNDEDLSNLRWTLDTDDDLEFMKQIYTALYHEGEIFLMKDILDLLKKNPEMSRVNVE
ncbi:cytidylyltransferase domain-containing protein [Chloroflexota bacterium]